MNRPTKLIISLALPLAAGLIGSLFTAPAIPTWYAELSKPFFGPPNWIFAPVWTTLYILMGIALYRVWAYRGLVTLFVIHLVFNALWSILFFGLQSPLLGLFDILLLLGLIILMTIKFYRVDRLAAYLLVPYLAWVSFATLLNFSIWWLN
jgi:tryptophan-rich sensory protein